MPQLPRRGGTISKHRGAVAAITLPCCEATWGQGRWRSVTCQSRRQSRTPVAMVIGSMILGAAYFAYLNAVDFPPDLARAVPLLWLAIAILGALRSGRAMAARGRNIPNIVGVALSIPNILLAALFSLGALM